MTELPSEMGNSSETEGPEKSQHSFAVAFLGLGANLGEPASTLKQACREIAAQSGISDVRSASLYSSAPVNAPGPYYTNTVVQLHTTLSPLNLLERMQSIEKAFGRQRNALDERNAPRTLDIDLLWFDDVSIEVPRLTLPHPRMHQRAFVLMPLEELAGSSFILLGRPLSEWLQDCRDQACTVLAPT